MISGNRLHRVQIALVLFSLLLLSNLVQASNSKATLFQNESFTQTDAILVVDEQAGVLFEWQANKAMVPASLSKLATAALAIDKWGEEHRFHTDFFRHNNQLWVKGYGDPYLVSEEIDLLVTRLNQSDLSWVESLHIDDSYFQQEPVPGRSKVNDPYNAPLSAVSANFNTAMLLKKNGVIQSAEPQTPLTPTAKRLASELAFSGLTSDKAQRINLRNRSNAQQHFAEILTAKLNRPDWHIHVNQRKPESATGVLRYQNSHSVSDIVRGMLEFSNNFMANQLFLMLPENQESVSFSAASDQANQVLAKQYAWTKHDLHEGSGLSRKNRLSANQINNLLVALKPYKNLLKKTKNKHAKVRAKTGTLNGVRSFAGFIDFPKTSYRFVFIFNRQVPWRHREQLLTKLIDQLHQQFLITPEVGSQ